MLLQILLLFFLYFAVAFTQFKFYYYFRVPLAILLISFPIWKDFKNDFNFSLQIFMKGFNHTLIQTSKHTAQCANTEPQKYLSFSSLIPSYLLKVTKFLGKISQFEFLVIFYVTIATSIPPAERGVHTMYIWCVQA